ncbi:HNH endonuclease [Brevundimonas nasdae]|nr:HNH endonuclease [Brevundimonas nasdae]
MADAVTKEWIESRSEPELNTGCLLWSGPTFRNGYGRAKGGLAHRASWVASHGPIAPGLHVLHRCDTPACVNVGHLSLGTHRDNMRDMTRKGRARRAGILGRLGESHPRARLDVRLVRLIRARQSAGEQMKAIASDLNVHKDTVRSVVTGRTWSHVK